MPERLSGEFSAGIGRFEVPAGPHPVPVTTSVGVLSIGEPGATDGPEEVLAAADGVMYRVKRAGKGRCDCEERGPASAGTPAVPEQPQ